VISLFPKDILCSFSGGGFRATFFHAGVLRAFVRLGVNKQVKVISSVSGGSIISALFGLRFDHIVSINDFDQLILKPLIDFSKRDPRNKLVRYRIFKAINSISAGVGSLLGPIGRPLSMLAGKENSIVFMEEMDQHLFHRKTMADISKNLRIVINSTNMNNGARWRFDNNDFGDYKTGYSYDMQHIPISFAVMASACYPGLFSPLKMKISDYKFYLRDKNKQDAPSPTPTPDSVYLSDGGIFDNLGYFSIKSELDRGRDGFIIISDAANRFDQAPIQYGFWNSILRVVNILMEQVSNRDRDRIMDNIKCGNWQGSYFKLENSCRYYRQYKDKQSASPEDVPEIGWSDATVARIAKIRTDLDYFTEAEVQSLICHGETIVETILAKWHNPVYKQLCVRGNTNMYVNPKECEKELFRRLENSNRLIR
jgi:NTE family protein